jgi:hypothetical protein
LANNIGVAATLPKARPIKATAGYLTIQAAGDDQHISGERSVTNFG